jgi:hypothetical protein
MRGPGGYPWKQLEARIRVTGWMSTHSDTVVSNDLVAKRPTRAFKVLSICQDLVFIVPYNGQPRVGID